ncbi:MAG: NAD(P)H-dependent flavin oxidoreductase [Candidatus Thorarchaeota archaeon]
MIWNTNITEMTETKYPIIMGAFAFLGRAEFASAFSDAGGLGIITALNFNNADEFGKEIEKMKILTDKPFGVNFTITPPYLRRGGRSWTEEFYMDFLDIAIDAGVKVFTTSAYRAPKLGKKIKNADCYRFHKCTTLKHALAAEKSGVDAITLVGLEGTGFKNPNQNTTLINVTMGKKLLKIPIIAAGGIGDARGFLAALIMGADAVCFGSAIIATTESPASTRWKNKILNQDIFDEIYYKKIYHLQLKDSPIGSMAIGHCKKIISLKEFIGNIINQSEQKIEKGLINKENRIIQMTGSKYPIMMGAFAGIGTAPFAAAFSNAGGFGIITASIYNTKEKFREALELTKKLTNNPFGVNFSVVSSEMAKSNPRLRTEDSYLDYINIAIEEGVKVCTTSAYQANKIGKKLHKAGCYWFHKCALVKHAVSAEKYGVDAITLVGIEGAGAKNPYQNTTLINITMARDLLQVPIIAAGGIGDARGFLGALAMGAEAVCFGTAILATKECPAPENYKKKIITQNIFDEDYHKKIFDFNYRDITVGSMASGHIKKSISVNEFISNIIINAKKILKNREFETKKFDFL